MKQEFHIENATDADDALIREIFKSVETKFHLVNTMLSCLIEGMICNCSEGLGWGFGLGALRIDSLIIVGLNPCKATPECYRPTFDYIISSLRQGFGERVILIDPPKQIDLSTLPRVPITEAHREFHRRLLASKKPLLT